MEHTDTHKKPLLTVLMLSYNDEAYVAEALESVLHQQGFNDFEIVITDDASKDGTVDIIKDYTSRYPNIIHPVYNQTNLGITDNFNQTLKRCSGKYVSFLAADDVYDLDKLTKQIVLMESNPNCALSYHNVSVFGSAIKKEYLYYGGLRGRKAYETKNGDISLFIKERNFLVAPSVMVRADAIPTHGFHPEIPKISDWLFFAEIATKGDVIYIDDILGGYRRHFSNTTSSYIEIDEFEKSYEILERNYPQYRKEIIAGKARLYLSFFILNLLKGKLKKSVDYSRKTLRLLPLGDIHMFSFLLKSLVKDIYQYSVRLASGWKI